MHERTTSRTIFEEVRLLASAAECIINSPMKIKKQYSALGFCLAKTKSGRIIFVPNLEAEPTEPTTQQIQIEVKEDCLALYFCGVPDMWDDWDFCFVHVRKDNMRAIAELLELICDWHSRDLSAKDVWDFNSHDM